jgi:hypothetical protein
MSERSRNVEIQGSATEGFEAMRAWGAKGCLPFCATTEDTRIKFGGWVWTQRGLES